MIVTFSDSPGNGKGIKQVYVDVSGRMHSLYKRLMTCPPNGYHFIANETNWDKLSNTLVNSNLIYSFQDRLLNKVIPVNIVKAYLDRFNKPPNGTDLTYTTGQLLFRKEPWIVDLEFVTQLSGYSIKYFKGYKGLIERTLTSKYCKNITSITEAGIKTVLLNLDSTKLAEKVEVIRPAILKKNFTKNYNNDRVKLLFVGSANIVGEFEYKGGKEVLEAFAILHQKYSNLELVIRSDIPKEIKTKYKGLNNLRIIEETIPCKQLEQEFKSADIFLFPSHSTPALAILDAMSYELPVITTDVWANPELVSDGKTGFVVKKSERVPYCTENFIPNWDYHTGSKFMESIKTTDSKVVAELVEKTSLLIENKELRRRMGKAGRWEIESGKFSLKKRNEKLKRIFDGATKT